MQKLLPLLLLFLSVHYAKSQDFKYGEIKDQELKMTRYAKDTTAHAVVLAEFGKSHISSVDDGLPLIFEHHVKLKIFDTKGLDKAIIEIPFYIGDPSSPEYVYDIKGISYYQGSDGKVHQTELDKKKIFNVKENKYWGRIKFTMPDVHPGTIIEYSYTLSSPYRQNFRKWVFQDDIPKVYSEYEAQIPAIYNYNAALHGYLKLTRNKSTLNKDCFSIYGARCDCSNITYVIENVPAFIEEDYMTSPKNFISSITYELTDYTDLNNGSTKKVAITWNDVDNALRRNDYFGSYLRKKTMLKKEIAPVIAGITDSLDKAKAIYSFIQKNLKWNKVYSIYTDGIKQALQKHTGTVADVNMALTIALTSAGFDADIVLLSTRDNGNVNKLYPVITEFDYVVTKININGKSYLLDATDALLPFGILPMRCLNDQGRVISMDKSSYWIGMNTDQKQSNIYSFDLTLQNNGKLKGTMGFVSKGYSAFERRSAIKNYNTVDEYVESLDEKLSRVKILNHTVKNIDSLDMPILELYDVEIDAYDNTNHEQLSFNPFVYNRITTNPFKLDERAYPVDWGMPSETRYILKLQLPDNYMVSSSLQPEAFTMPNDGAKVLATFESQGHGLIFSHIMQFNKSVYNSNEYHYLKEFYNKIILSEKSDIILKKTK